MSPVLTKHFSELSTREYHRIVQAREAVFFLEQHITEPDADAVDPQSVFMWMEDGGRVVAFLRIIPAGIAYAEASVGRVLVDAAYRRRGLCRSLMSEAAALYCPDMGPPAHPHLGTRAPGRILRHPRVRTGLGHLFRSRYPARQNAPPVARHPGKKIPAARGFPAPPEPYLY